MQQGGQDLTSQAGLASYEKSIHSWADGSRFVMSTEQEFTTELKNRQKWDLISENEPNRTSAFPTTSHHIPPELEAHLRICRCTCNHLGYGNYQVCLSFYSL